MHYAIEVNHVADRDERRKLSVAYNSLFRKVYNYRTWESVTELQHSLRRPTWKELPSDGVDRDTGGESGHLPKMIPRPRETF